ncbi:MAG: preprotein translocase subunit SecA, partial [Burkholderiales bacterium]
PGGSLYDATNITLVHHLYAALRAHALFHRDQNYVVQNGEVIIVDEFTGRLMPGRRWSEGLHQAIEAKERVKIQHENQTLASITFQNYFRLYRKLAGMTGTAETEAFEFQHIYGLETVVIPTHREMVRIDNMDQVFRTAEEKYQAVITDIRGCYVRGQPVLVGTTSIENSESLSSLLTGESLPHQVLNAKQHEREAAIVAQAGRPKMITIATNMAGRGTDIVLGGNPEPEINRVRDDAELPEPEKTFRIEALRAEWRSLHEQVLAAGGLHIIGTERHESRRIDNQLRGRAGRQGDPGSSRFYLSLQDSLLRIFASERVSVIMEKLNMPEGEAIEHRWVTRAIENAQRKVEARNFDIRKQLLEFDDVANDQRKVVYTQRNELLESTDISETLRAMRVDVGGQIVLLHVPPDSVEEQWDVPALEKALYAELGLALPISQWLEQDHDLHPENLVQRVIDVSNEHFQQKVAELGTDVMSIFARRVMLQSIDIHWREHLAALDHLRQGIGLRSYAQKKPEQEYKREAFELFSQFLDLIKTEVTRITMTVQIRSAEDVQKVEPPPQPEHVRYVHAGYDEALSETEAKEGESREQPFVRSDKKVGRNEPCQCGSGKKYKHCHGKLT